MAKTEMVSETARALVPVEVGAAPIVLTTPTGEALLEAAMAIDRGRCAAGLTMIVDSAETRAAAERKLFEIRDIAAEVRAKVYGDWKWAANQLHKGFVEIERQGLEAIEASTAEPALLAKIEAWDRAERRRLEGEYEIHGIQTGKSGSACIQPAGIPAQYVPKWRAGWQLGRAEWQLAEDARIAEENRKKKADADALEKAGATPAQVAQVLAAPSAPAAAPAAPPPPAAILAPVASSGRANWKARLVGALEGDEEPLTPNTIEKLASFLTLVKAIAASGQGLDVLALEPKQADGAARLKKAEGALSAYPGLEAFNEPVLARPRKGAA